MGKWMLIVCLLSGCHDPTEIEYRTKIPDKNREAARVWVAQCILDANPHSDEEPEDWIRQCETTATRLFGEYTAGVRRRCEEWNCWEPVGLAKKVTKGGK